MFRRHIYLLVLGPLLVVFPCGTASSAGPQGMLTADPAPSSPRVRWNAPISVLWKVYWHGSSIVEGHFEMTYTDGQRTVCRARSHDMVLSPGEQTIRLGLPTAGSFVSWRQDEVHIRFVAKDQTYDLGRYPLLGRTGSRSLSLCICSSGEQLDDTQTDVLKSLRFGTLLGEEQASIATVNTHWSRDDMPVSPLYYCNFDIVVLTAVEFVELRQKQLDAILKWARAGGSVCVFLDAALEPRHAEFLNSLLSNPTKPPFLVDSNGSVIVDDTDREHGMWLARSELGRSAIVDVKAMSNLHDFYPRSRYLSAFLWKIRNKQVDLLVHEPSALRQSRQRRMSGYQHMMAWQPMNSVGQFLERLMPTDVRVVPTSLIAIMLVGYLVVIGPVDYYLLGYFRMRRFTWITFPLATVAVTLLCVAVSEAFLSSKNTGKTLVIRDMGSDGSVLRENRFQLVFKASRGTIATEVRNEIFTPIDQERLSLSSQYAFQYRYYQYANRAGIRSQSRVPEYTGLMPLHYEVRQTIDQWRPQINRFFAIAPERQIEFNWNRSKDVTTAAGRDKLRDVILKQWPHATALVLNRSHKYHLSGPSVFTTRQPRRDDPWRAYRGALPPSDLFLLDICRRRPEGVFQLISQLSPNGGDNFEDLTLLDESDPRQWLLVIAVEEGDNIVIYRQLFGGADQ